MRQLLAFWKLIRMISHIATGLLTVWLRFPRLTPAQKQQRVMAWSQELLARLAIELIVKGRPPANGPLLLVANHISWIDIASVHAVCYCRFVAKSDMKRWPVIGTLTAGIGTLFIERESRRDAMRVVHHMADSLRAGDVLAVFPEGTTSDGSSLLPFHANLTQAAIFAQVPVQPMALTFLDALSGKRSVAPAYAGDDSLLRSVWRTLSAPPLSVVVTLGELQHAGERDRRAWTADLHAAVHSLRSGV